jgi:transposase
VEKVINHAQAISKLLKSINFDPTVLKNHIYSIVSYSKEFSRFIQNEQDRQLISSGIKNLLEKAIETLQNLDINRDSLPLLQATTELLRDLTTAINNEED